MNAPKIISIFVIISILTPIASYLYFEKTFNSKIEAYESSLKSENDRLMGIIEELNQENINLTQRLTNAQTLINPFLVTTLGWYLHNSTDPVYNSRNTFTIYGSVENTGVTPARNCSLTIQFYKNATLLQTSTISMGDISNEYYLSRKDIPCLSADSITKVEITPTWS